jgi:MFS family permease
MSAVLELVGYTGLIKQLNVILINNCQEFGWSILGSLLVDKFGRRPLLLFANIGCALAWAGMTVATYQLASPSGTTNTAAAQGALAMVFIFSAIYCFGMTPLQSLYPVEVLSFEMRAKGMALSNFVIGGAGLLNQFAWPIALDRIGWATYMIFSVWCAVQAVVIYFTIVETKNRTVSLSS